LHTIDTQVVARRIAFALDNLIGSSYTLILNRLTPKSIGPELLVEFKSFG